ncbi:MAG: hypothetical protein R2695_07900 [Acidimicrobiales bacterium]
MFAPVVDERLGRLRELAAARLTVEEIERGWLDHLLPPSEDQSS